MNHITFKDKEGFDINVLAFDGESNFAILDRTSTGSPTPYVVVKGLDTESAMRKKSGWMSMKRMQKRKNWKVMKWNFKADCLKKRSNVVNE